MISGRYEESTNYSSFDPKIAFKSKLNDFFQLVVHMDPRFQCRMAQMFSSEINLGSVRDFDDNIFVRQAQIGNPNLKPSLSDNINFSIEFEHLDRVHNRLLVYRL